MVNPINVTRRCMLGAAALGWAPSFSVWAVSNNVFGSPPPLEAEQMEAEGAYAGVCTVRARGSKNRLGAALWVRNDSGRSLPAIQVVVRGLSLGGKEEFFVRFQWTGSLAPKMWAFVGATTFELERSDPDLPVVALKVEVVQTKIDGTSAGPEAVWSVAASEWASLLSEMGDGVELDAVRSRAYVTSKGGGVPLVSSFAKMWAKPGMNPYDPQALNVAFAWQAIGNSAVKIKNLKATFFQSSSLSPFLRVEVLGSWSARPGESGMTLSSFGCPGLDSEVRKNFENKAREHGVNMERGYVDILHAERVQG